MALDSAQFRRIQNASVSKLRLETGSMGIARFRVATLPHAAAPRNAGTLIVTKISEHVHQLLFALQNRQLLSKQ
jgi:hypothetical protein